MAFKTAEEQEEEQKAFDGSLMPIRRLPMRDKEYSIEKLANITRALESKRLSLKGMIFGDVGTKKTTGAMRILQAITPLDQKILYFDSAEGWSTLMNYPELMKRVIHQPVESIEQMDFMANYLLMQQKPFDSVGAVLFDEYTQMHDNDLNWIVSSRAEQMEADGKFKDPFTPALPDYNAARIRSNKLVSKYLRLPETHLIFIGHEKLNERREYVPDMPDKAGKALYQRLHFMYHVENVTPKDKNAAAYWRMQTTAGNRVLAKNRINGIPGYLHDKDADLVAERYLTWGTKETKPADLEIKTENSEEDILKAMEGK